MELCAFAPQDAKLNLALAAVALALGRYALDQGVTRSSNT
jgi:hypothetical protein